MATGNNLYKTLKISGIRENIKGFKTISFENNPDIHYAAGQYLTFVYQDHNTEKRRSYSIVSSPFLNEPLSIGVKRIENGLFSRILIDNAKTGDELKTIGSGGIFILPENLHQYKQVFFFAAGSGITPIFSLIKTLLHAYKNIHVILIYSNTSEDKTVFLNEIKHLEEKFQSKFQARFLFSNHSDLSKARLHRQMIIDFLQQFSIAGFGQTLFYICGPEAYMRLCTFTLQENDVPKSNIKREDFIINSARRRDALPPDTASHKVVLRMNNEVFSFEVNYPDSILQAAKKTNLTLPYSCESGRCASCMMQCVKGEVWHSYNEVLTEKELAEKRILTCTGHPVNGDIELVLQTN